MQKSSETRGSIEQKDVGEVYYYAAAQDDARTIRSIPKMVYRGVEQLVAHRAHNPKVAGSNPAPATATELQKTRLAFSRRSGFLCWGVSRSSVF